ncbi:uncharacterized protein LOC143460980 isoform X3 [Clavelina lepadiformis]|uniref:uncharacterized protein LOC143460980 isoform X3 n=1 Tax=Clavelina lepadiformis TaxID=159417 RepID=UPI0040416077
MLLQVLLLVSSAAKMMPTSNVSSNEIISGRGQRQTTTMSAERSGTTANNYQPEETKTKASGESKLSEDREIPSIYPRDRMWSSTLLASPSAQEEDGNPKATISAERTGHPSEATAGSFPMDPQTVESTIEPSDRTSSFVPVPWPDPSLAPLYELMTSPLQNEVIPPFSEGQTSTLTSATNSAFSDEATVTNNNPAKKRKQVWRKPKTKFTPEQLATLQKEFNLNPALSKQRKKEIALRTKLTEEIVQTWFGNNRKKMKKM